MLWDRYGSRKLEVGEKRAVPVVHEINEKNLIIVVWFQTTILYKGVAKSRAHFQKEIGPLYANLSKLGNSSDI